MENQANSKSIILNYGLYLGLAVVIISLVKYAMGALYTQEYYSGIIGFALMIAFVVLGIKKFKTDNGGFLSFGQAVKVGIGVAMIAAVINVVYIYLLANFIEPDFAVNTVEAQKTMMADSFGMTEGQIEEATKSSLENFNLSLLGGALIGNLFIGGVISLIAGAIMKKSEEETY
ncbi:DUF4199 domain-containing protein [uncultured Polaribacter sp.]|uniref:DUF4199 domain-containing protein n=1 Tax=uncultured Polaribacter sp. TaxID=174711 RepID=UPI002611685F|nr:DUF4199 domain-containing protein [uncultured Polaribacter sp.]